MRSAFRAWPFLATLALCIGCDWTSKAAAVALLGDAPPIALAGGTVRIELAYNPGAFLSLGASWPPLLRVLLLQWLVPAGLVALCVWLLRSGAQSRRQQIALGLLAGGGFGNAIDRIGNAGLVTDFVSIGIGALRTGVFNVADVAVIAGVLLFALAPSSDSTQQATAVRTEP